MVLLQQTEVDLFTQRLAGCDAHNTRLTPSDIHRVPCTSVLGKTDVFIELKMEKGNGVEMCEGEV